jgi:sarcosine oxidase subunit delta
MQIFPCPFCGPRDETEFTYVAEAGKTRPALEGGAQPGAAWSRFLYFQDNPKGCSTEIWLHGTCGEYFSMTRDTATHEVVRSAALKP